MERDILNMFQIFFILFFFTSIFYYCLYSLKRLVKKFHFRFIKKVYCSNLNFQRNIGRENYVSFEKYNIWRFRFKF